ncbi:MAG: SUMF1/EgtB/PvdO family nonheme iron enzyme [bacterium]
MSPNPLPNPGKHSIDFPKITFCASIIGNFYEWCWDKYGSYPTGNQTNYTGVTSATNFRIIRGGYWLGELRACRSAHRSMSSLTYSGKDVGVRFVRTIN